MSEMCASSFLELEDVRVHAWCVRSHLCEARGIRFPSAWGSPPCRFWKAALCLLTHRPES